MVCTADCFLSTQASRLRDITPCACACLSVYVCYTYAVRAMLCLASGNTVVKINQWLSHQSVGY